MVKHNNSKKHTWKLDKGEVITRHLRKTKRKIVRKKLKNAKNMELDVLIGGGDKILDTYKDKVVTLKQRVDFLETTLGKFNKICFYMTENIQKNVEDKTVGVITKVFSNGYYDNGLKKKHVEEISELRLDIYKYIFGVDSKNQARYLTGDRWGRNVLDFEVCDSWFHTKDRKATGTWETVRLFLLTLTFSIQTIKVGINKAIELYKDNKFIAIECQVKALRLLESEMTGQIRLYTQGINHLLNRSLSTIPTIGNAWSRIHQVPVI